MDRRQRKHTRSTSGTILVGQVKISRRRSLPEAAVLRTGACRWPIRVRDPRKTRATQRASGQRSGRQHIRARRRPPITCRDRCRRKNPLRSDQRCERVRGRRVAPVPKGWQGQFQGQFLTSGYSHSQGLSDSIHHLAQHGDAGQSNGATATSVATVPARTARDNQGSPHATISQLPHQCCLNRSWPTTFPLTSSSGRVSSPS
jgi:hypothetical protein